MYPTPYHPRLELENSSPNFILVRLRRCFFELCTPLVRVKVRVRVRVRVTVTVTVGVRVGVAVRVRVRGRFSNTLKGLVIPSDSVLNNTYCHHLWRRLCVGEHLPPSLDWH
jgi:hypothetical protein